MVNLLKRSARAIWSQSIFLKIEKIERSKIERSNSQLCQKLGLNASFYYYSWGTGCGKKGLPGVYTDVYHFITSQDKWLCNALNLKNACPKKVICWCLSFHNQPGQMAMQSFKPVEFMSLEGNLLIS